MGLSATCRAADRTHRIRRVDITSQRASAQHLVLAGTTTSASLKSPRQSRALHHVHHVHSDVFTLAGLKLKGNCQVLCESYKQVRDLHWYNHNFKSNKFAVLTERQPKQKKETVRECTTCKMCRQILHWQGKNKTTYRCNADSKLRGCGKVWDSFYIIKYTNGT